MSYKIHESIGLILDSSDSGESSRILTILTPEYGILKLIATGVREEKSKMRGSLTLASDLTFEFVEGKEWKRLTGVKLLNKREKIFENFKKRTTFMRVVQFLERVVVGDLPNEELYEKVLKGLNVLKDYDAEMDVEVLEMSMVMQILQTLGYWEYDKYLNYDAESLSFIKDKKDLFVLNINKAISLTHL